MSFAENLAFLAQALTADSSKNLTAANSPPVDDNSKLLATTASVLAQWTAAGKQQMATNGYQKFPGGLTLQWGLSQATPAGSAVSFPIAFSNNCFVVITGPASVNNTTAAQTPTKTGFTFYASNTSLHWWAAIGN